MERIERSAIAPHTLRQLEETARIGLKAWQSHLRKHGRAAFLKLIVAQNQEFIFQSSPVYQRSAII